MKKDLDTNMDISKKVKLKTGRWQGKVGFEDFMTGTLHDILEESRKTNRLLSKLESETEPDNRSLKDKALDLFDDGKINRSNVKKRSKKDRK